MDFFANKRYYLYSMDSFTFKKIENFNEKDLAGINRLLTQWSDTGYQMNADYFKELIIKSHILCLYNNEDMIGTVTLVPLYKLSGSKGSVEHLIIDESQRGKGLGEKLMRFALDFAKEQNIETLFLTCEPQRIAANALYKKLGFTIKDTSFYQLNLH